jgi:uncharacterized protein
MLTTCHCLRRKAQRRWVGRRGGGVYIVDRETRAEAEAFIEADPFFQASLFERVSIVRMRKAYLDGISYLKR